MNDKIMRQRRIQIHNYVQLSSICNLRKLNKYKEVYKIE